MVKSKTPKICINFYYLCQLGPEGLNYSGSVRVKRLPIP